MPPCAVGEVLRTGLRSLSYQIELPVLSILDMLPGNFVEKIIFEAVYSLK